ncbi:MAG: hypothetical protein HZA19_06095, partial [Nitrospirae bacterium]|nr:hypothetical protein [Nitrospirota bacterium]
MSAGRSILIEAILKEGERKSREILEKAESQADERIAGISSETAHRETESLGQMEQGLSRYRVRERNRILFEAKRKIALVQEKRLRELLEWVRPRLSRLRETPDYPDRLRLLWQEALQGVDKAWNRREDTGRAPLRRIVRVHPADRSFMTDILNTDAGWTILPDETISGGVCLDIGEGSVRFFNTFESRLERGWPDWLPEIRKIFFVF